MRSPGCGGSVRPRRCSPGNRPGCGIRKRIGCTGHSSPGRCLWVAPAARWVRQPPVPDRRAHGLYLVDPAAGEAPVQGFVVVTSGPIGGGNFIPPADVVVTLNGVALLRDPKLNGAFFRLDPDGPRPAIGSGGQMVIVAVGTDPADGRRIQRQLV